MAGHSLGILWSAFWVSHLHWDAGRMQQYYKKISFLWNGSLQGLNIIYVHWRHIWNRFLLVFSGTTTSSWSQPLRSTPGCELSWEQKCLHRTTLLVSTAPAVCVLQPSTQSGHPERDSKVALVQSLQTPGTELFLQHRRWGKAGTQAEGLHQTRAFFTLPLLPFPCWAFILLFAQ